MGVYLPNVDMPKDDKCVTIQICPDGSIWQQYRGTVPNAKAVPIPPHGRLIDADVLFDFILNIYKNAQGEARKAYSDVLDVIVATGDVIPAEEGET